MNMKKSILAGLCTGLLIVPSMMEASDRDFSSSSSEEEDIPAAKERTKAPTPAATLKTKGKTKGLVPTQPKKISDRLKLRMSAFEVKRNDARDASYYSATSDRLKEVGLGSKSREAEYRKYMSDRQAIYDKDKNKKFLEKKEAQQAKMIKQKRRKLLSNIYGDEDRTARTSQNAGLDNDDSYFDDLLAVEPSSLDANDNDDEVPTKKSSSKAPEKKVVDLFSDDDDKVPMEKSSSKAPQKKVVDLFSDDDDKVPMEKSSSKAPQKRVVDLFSDDENDTVSPVSTKKSFRPAPKNLDYSSDDEDNNDGILETLEESSKTAPKRRVVDYSSDDDDNDFIFVVDNDSDFVNLSFAEEEAEYSDAGEK